MNTLFSLFTKEISFQKISLLTLSVRSNAFTYFIFSFIFLLFILITKKINKITPRPPNKSHSKLTDISNFFKDCKEAGIDIIGLLKSIFISIVRWPGVILEHVVRFVDGQSNVDPGEVKRLRKKLNEGHTITIFGGCTWFIGLTIISFKNFPSVGLVLIIPFCISIVLVLLILKEVFLILHRTFFKKNTLEEHKTGKEGS